MRAAAHLGRSHRPDPAPSGCPCSTCAGPWRSSAG